MVPKTISRTGTGVTPWYPVDFVQKPFNASVSVVVSGTVTYDIEHTFDNVFDTTVTPTVFKHATLVNQTTNGNSNYAFPIRAVRLNITAGTGSADFTWMQGASQ